MSKYGDRSKRNRVMSWAINGCGVLLFAAVLVWGGAGAWKEIARPEWGALSAAFGVTLLWNLVAAARWMAISRPLSPEAAGCPFRYFFTYHMLGMLTGQVVPISVGMLGARPVALSLSRGVPIRRAALSVFLDKLFDLVLALLLSLPVVLYLASWVGLSLALGLMAGLSLLGLGAVAWRYEQTVRGVGRLGPRLGRLSAHIPFIGRRLAQRLPRLFERLAAASSLPSSLALRAMALTIVMYVLLSARLFFIAQALRLDIPWYLLVMGTCVTQVTMVFAITPGSLGFLEGGWAAVLSLAGLAPAQIPLFLIGRRAFVLVFILINTLLAFAWIWESPAHLFRAVLVASRRRGAGVDGTPPGEGLAGSQPGEG